ncbi:hypothetical protein ONS96_005470 [Cadophora gregata f. sp. sojae]|nr:hypothetical protein ONS96_005470 [Cadophora gregata f. sp. sojae]
MESLSAEAGTLSRARSPFPFHSQLHVSFSSRDTSSYYSTLLYPSLLVRLSPHLTNSIVILRRHSVIDILRIYLFFINCDCVYRSGSLTEVHSLNSTSHFP